MTWNELKEAIENLPPEVLDMPAQCWCPSDVDFSQLDEFLDVYDISPYDGDLPASYDNPVSMTFGI